MDRNDILTQFSVFMASKKDMIPDDIAADGERVAGLLLSILGAWCEKHGHDRSPILYPADDEGIENMTLDTELFLETLPPIFKGRHEVARHLLPGFLSQIKEAIDGSIHDSVHDALYDFMVDEVDLLAKSEWDAHQAYQEKRLPFLDMVAGED